MTEPIDKTMKSVPLAYFITFSCYGTHLHGHESESVDRSHNKYGAPHLPSDDDMRRRKQDAMIQTPYHLDMNRGIVVLDSIKKTSTYRKWNLLAAHVRSTHIHVVVQAMAAPEKVMNDLKSYASRSLNNAGFENSGCNRWTRHGSTRYLWKAEEIGQAIHYVLHEQGEKMAVYENKSLDIEAIFKNQKKPDAVALPHGRR